MTLRRAAALALLALTTAAPAAAGALVEMLKERQAKIDALLARHPGALPPAARGQLERALAGAFDFEAMSRRALADWERRTAAERGAYVRVFERLIRASLVRQPDIYRALKVEYTAERADAVTGRVETVVRSKEATTEVAYDLVAGAGGWRICDYTIDGVSTARNYRSQFGRILQKDGWDGLLQRIEKRASSIEAEEP